MEIKERQTLINRDYQGVSIRRQCALLNINRSNIYYEERIDNYNLELMKLLDEEYTRHPSKGVIKMTKYLEDLGHWVNVKRVRRLLRTMGLMAIYPKKKRMSQANPANKIYPYLLKGYVIDKPNQVWSVDITYIRLLQGFVYLVAIIDWYSRYVLSWKLSNTMDVSFCIEALQDALMYERKPEIFNSDQGSQFTSEAFINILKSNNIKISMDGRGRAFDNIFVERLWRSVKYEEVYLHEYSSAKEAKEKLKTYFEYYNYERHHQSLKYKKPAEVYLMG